MSDTEDLQDLGDVETMLMAALAGVRKLFNRHAGSTMRLTYVAGNAQSGAAGEDLPVLFKVKVTLADGTTPVAGEVVTFDSLSDGGFSPTSVTSDASGFAESTWTLPRGTGATGATAEHTRSGQTVDITATSTVGAAARLNPLTATNQAGTTSLAVSAPPSAQLVDSFNNPLGAGLTVSTALSGGGSRNPTGLTTDANGVVTQTSWTMSAVAGTHTLTMSYPGVPDLVFTADAVAGGLPVSIVIQAGGSQSGGVVGLSTSPYTFRVKDAGLAGVPGVTVRFTSVPGAAPVDQVTDANGDVVASFTYGTVAGLQNTFSATFTTAASVDVTAQETATPVAGAAVALRYVQQPPSNMNSGDTMAPQPAVEVIDSYGNRKLSGTGATATIALSVVVGSDATLGGTVTGAATAGLKTFTNVSLTDATGGNSTLRATATISAVVYTIDSNTISAAPPIPHHCVISTQPPSSTTLGTGFTFVVDVVDSNGVRIPGDTSTITVTLTNNTEGASLLNNGTTTLTAVCTGGRATFALSVTVQTGSFTVLAERGSDDAFDVTSNAFTVTAAGSTNEPGGMTVISMDLSAVTPDTSYLTIGGGVQGVNIGNRKWYTATAKTFCRRVSNQVALLANCSLASTVPACPNGQDRFESTEFGGGAGFSAGEQADPEHIITVGAKTLYYSGYVLVSSNFYGQSTGRLKLVYPRVNVDIQHSTALLIIKGTSGGALNFAVHYNGPVGGYTDIVPSSGAGGSGITRNVWYFVEYQVVANTGAGNGQATLWVNGVKVHQRNDVTWTQTAWSGQQQVLTFYGGTGTTNMPAGKIFVARSGWRHCYSTSRLLAA